MCVQYLGSTITEVQVGLGPAGEMRYPSYQSAYWVFPGVGEFQCYDKYMLSMLYNASVAAGHPEWGKAGPKNAGSWREFESAQEPALLRLSRLLVGTYNSTPQQTGFFNPSCNNCDNYASPYGQFFLSTRLLVYRSIDAINPLTAYYWSNRNQTGTPRY